ncbi:myelin transcription factor 1-like isoform X1 [Montipora capricornis]|uniref:myelin transcription factor 1-like isoform X1 n=1 Tax=Montipora capricornis TaxID=246305 RepID=UPI0035F147B9
MKLFLLLAFILLATNIFVAADEKESEMLRMLEKEVEKDEPIPEEDKGPRSSQEVADEEEEGEESEQFRDMNVNEELKESDEEKDPFYPEVDLDEEEKKITA